MQNALQHALRNTVRPLILPLWKVHDGTHCVHTGMRQVGRNTLPSKLGEHGDKGVVFVKTCNHVQRTNEGKHVIFGLHDLVIVSQK